MLNTSGKTLWKKKTAEVTAQVVDPKNYQLKRRHQRKENYRSAGIKRLSVKFV
jgi:hypothetical protein